MFSQMGEMGQTMTNEWIEWNGGKCPVAGDVAVEVIYQYSSNPSLDYARRLNFWNTGNIEKYCIYQTPRELELEKQLAIAKEVLEFYADSETYCQPYRGYGEGNDTRKVVEKDEGKIAQQALKKLKG